MIDYDLENQKTSAIITAFKKGTIDQESAVHHLRMDCRFGEMRAKEILSDDNPPKQFCLDDLILIENSYIDKDLYETLIKIDNAEIIVDETMKEDLLIKLKKIKNCGWAKEMRTKVRSL